MLSIAICTYNRASQLDLLLANLSAVLEPDPQGVELVLVDNNSKDNTAELAHNYAAELPLNYCFEPDQGLANARNRAIKEANGSAIWFLDDDTSISAETLQAYLSALANLPEYEFFGGPIVVDWQQQKPVWLNNDYLVILQGLFGAYTLGDDESDYAMNTSGPYGANFVVRTSLFSRIGGFDPALGVKGNELGRGEESEFFVRAKRAQAKGRYLPHAEVLHRFQLERISVSYLYRYGKAKGQEEVVVQGRGAKHWIGEAVSQSVRGLGQLILGRRGNFYQCLVNVGIARGRYLATRRASESA
jgi:glycosyltransferase involved in cell wall biosynthesis